MYLSENDLNGIGREIRGTKAAGTLRLYRTKESASEPMWFRGDAAFIVGYHPKIFFRSSSGVLIGEML